MDPCCVRWLSASPFPAPSKSGRISSKGSSDWREMRTYGARWARPAGVTWTLAISGRTKSNTAARSMESHWNGLSESLCLIKCRS
jgi:hypothetical protein